VVTVQSGSALTVAATNPNNIFGISEDRAELTGNCTKSCRPWLNRFAGIALGFRYNQRVRRHPEHGTRREIFATVSVIEVGYVGTRGIHLARLSGEHGEGLRIGKRLRERRLESRICI
jgi:hypothetical protein